MKIFVKFLVVIAAIVNLTACTRTYDSPLPPQPRPSDGPQPTLTESGVAEAVQPTPAELAQEHQRKLEAQMQREHRQEVDSIKRLLLELDAKPEEQGWDGVFTANKKGKLCAAVLRANNFRSLLNDKSVNIYAEIGVDASSVEQKVRRIHAESAEKLFQALKEHHTDEGDCSEAGEGDNDLGKPVVQLFWILQVLKQANLKPEEMKFNKEQLYATASAAAQKDLLDFRKELQQGSEDGKALARYRLREWCEYLTPSRLGLTDGEIALVKIQ